MADREQVLATCRACEVMQHTGGTWQYVGQCKLQLTQTMITNTFRITGRNISTGEWALNEPLFAGTKFDKCLGLFIRWEDRTGHVYGFSFESEEEATDFEEGMQLATRTAPATAVQQSPSSPLPSVPASIDVTDSTRDVILRTKSQPSVQRNHSSHLSGLAQLAEDGELAKKLAQRKAKFEGSDELLPSCASPAPKPHIAAKPSQPRISSAAPAQKPTKPSDKPSQPQVSPAAPVQKPTQPSDKPSQPLIASAAPVPTPTKQADKLSQIIPPAPVQPHLNGGLRLCSDRITDVDTADTVQRLLKATALSSAPQIKALGITYPSTWDKPDKHDPYQRTQLQPNDPEYEQVIANVRRTANDTAVQIVKIERIENHSLYQVFMVFRDMLIQRDDSDQSCERQLWHGTGVDALTNIYAGGFNRSYCGKNATFYGDGVYFARDFEYSAQRKYSPPDENGVKHVFQCRVLTGQFTVGTSGMIEPPLRKGHIRYDSVVNNITNPEIFVIFKDMHAYPEYLVSFK